jgi:GNAT superfamily N-acetyltransferase
MFRRPAPLSESHDQVDFDCGNVDLNTFLIQRAMTNQHNGYSRTYVVAEKGQRVVGYYSVCSSVIGRNLVPRQIGGHGAPSDIPVVLLGRLAVDRRFQGQNLGADLLRHAMQMAVLSSETIGVRALLVHAIDDAAARFYQKYNFRPAKDLDRTLLRTLQDISISMQAEIAGR